MLADLNNFLTIEEKREQIDKILTMTEIQKYIEPFRSYIEEAGISGKDEFKFCLLSLLCFADYVDNRHRAKQDMVLGSCYKNAMYDCGLSMLEGNSILGSTPVKELRIKLFDICNNIILPKTFKIAEKISLKDRLASKKPKMKIIGCAVVKN